VDKVLTRRFLDRLVARGGCSIYYTHLGKLDRGSNKRGFSPAAVDAFRLLGEYADSGRILVTTTRRLLDHHAGSEDGSTPSTRESLKFPDIG
jgi:hypothetical protein